MQPSKTGEVPGLEFIKWLAFALMVVDHVARYAIHGLGPLPWLLGRLVFPLFAIALGVGTARRVDLRSVAWRLLVWGAVAQAAVLLAAGHVAYLNVLFTFFCGVVISDLLRGSARWWIRVVGISGAVLAGCACEYGVVGVVLVVAAMWWGRAHHEHARHWASTAALVLAVAALSPVNGTLFALVALPVAWALVRWPVEVPRLRRLFYVGYAAQWAGVGALAWWLR